MHLPLSLSHAPSDLAIALELVRQLRTAGWEVQLNQPVRQALETPQASQASWQQHAALLMLSAEWLRAGHCQRLASEALASGLPLYVLVHPGIPAEPADGAGRGRRARLEEALSGHPLEAELRRLPWHWMRPRADQVPDWGLPARLLDPTGTPPAAVPVTDAQRYAALYWSAQSRATALAARQFSAAQPDLALLLAAAAADLADTPQARSSLLAVLTEHSALRRILHQHLPGRPVRALVFSPDGRWLASGDSRAHADDDRPARLNLLDLQNLTLREATQSRSGQISALAWSRPWLAVATRGSVGWLRWDEDTQRFGARSPAPLSEPLLPRWLSWSGPQGPQGQEWLAWGCAEGLVGFARPGESKRLPDVRLRHAGQPDALQGLAWIGPDRLLCIEQNQLMLRPFPSLQPAVSLGALEQVHGLWASGGHWVVSGVQRGKPGVVRGQGSDLWAFEPSVQPGPFEVADLGQRGGESSWVQVTPAHGSPQTPALAVGPRLNDLQTLLPSDAVQTAGWAVDPWRRRVATGDEHDGAVRLWQLGEPHPLLTQVLPPGCVRLIAPGAGDHLLWADISGAIHSGVADSGENPDRLHPGFAPVRMLAMDNGQTVLALGEKGESAVLDLRAGQRRPVMWPSQPTRETLHLVACAPQAPRGAMIGPDGMLWLMEGPPQQWQPVAHWFVPGQALALALSPMGDQVYVMLAQGFIRVARWRLGGPDQPEWLMVLRQGAPGPMTLHDSGALLAADGPELHWLPPSGDLAEPSRLDGHDNPVRRLGATADTLVSVAGREQAPELDELRLWTPAGQPLGCLPVPGKVAHLVMSRSGRFAWLLLTTGDVWRLPLAAAGWARVAQFVAGRELTVNERRHHGLPLAAPQAPTAGAEDAGPARSTD